MIAPHVDFTIFPPHYAEIAKKLEVWETDPWAVRAILQCEILTRNVWDPCCGPGIMSEIAKAAGYAVVSSDVHNWQYRHAVSGVDFLLPCAEGFADVARDGTIFMNPPFSLACQFVDRAKDLGARKIVCFQRWAWWESAKRRDWWQAHAPNRIYACSDRADCQLITYQQEERDKNGGTRHAHAWFVWEKNQPNGPVIGHISKETTP